MRNRWRRKEKRQEFDERGKREKGERRGSVEASVKYERQSRNVGDS